MKLTITLIIQVVISVLIITANANDEEGKIDPSSIVTNMPANSWLEIPDSRLDSVAADPDLFPYAQGNGGIRGIVAYSGAVFDTRRNRLVIWGGGHNDYHGNEIYAFDTDTLVWERLTDPSVPNLCQEVNDDGTPNSRHTYNGIAYIEHADRLFGSGGALACGPGSCGAHKTWTFDFELKKWTDMNPAAGPETECENIAAYDPETKKVWWFSGGFWSFDYDTNTWAERGTDFIERRTAVVDTKRGILMVIGLGEVFAYHIRKGNYSRKVLQTSGGDQFIDEQKPGLAYDPVTDRIVGWSGDSVYALNPETNVWTEHVAPNGPNTDSLDGVYGMWRYVPSLNAFIVMTGAHKNIYFYKFAAGPG